MPKNKATFGVPEGALKKISALLDDDDTMAALTAIDRYMAEYCGLPHVDPIDIMDTEDVKVFIIWTRLAGRDWFDHHAGEIEDIIDADATELYDWLNRKHLD